MADVAVIVCTRGRPDAAVAVVRDVLEQAADVELVIVDQSDDVDNTRLIGAVPGKVRVARCGPVGLPAARNAGIALTTAPIVLFFDDDVRVMPGCVAAHARAYVDPRVGAVGGRIVERVVRPNAAPTVNRIDAAGRVRTNLSGAAPCDLDTVKGANMSFRREALLAIGPEARWFDPGFDGTSLLEDADASERVRRAGFAIRYEPTAEVVHLSLGAGGVRTDAFAAERSRFRNTGRFVGKHRPVTALLATLPVFSAIAVRRAAQWRKPAAVAALLTDLVGGWRAGRARS